MFGGVFFVSKCLLGIEGQKKLKTFTIDQFRYIKIQPKTIDLSTKPWGITTEFVGFISQSLVLRSNVLG